LDGSVVGQEKCGPLVHPKTSKNRKDLRDGVLVSLVDREGTPKGLDNNTSSKRVMNWAKRGEKGNGKT